MVSLYCKYYTWIQYVGLYILCQVICTHLNNFVFKFKVIITWCANFWGFTIIMVAIIAIPHMCMICMYICISYTPIYLNIISVFITLFKLTYTFLPFIISCSNTSTWKATAELIFSSNHCNLTSLMWLQFFEIINY